jgi:hypothetical protein
LLRDTGTPVLIDTQDDAPHRSAHLRARWRAKLGKMPVPGSRLLKLKPVHSNMFPSRHTSSDTAGSCQAALRRSALMASPTVSEKQRFGSSDSGLLIPTPLLCAFGYTMSRMKRQRRL